MKADSTVQEREDARRERELTAVSSAPPCADGWRRGRDADGSGGGCATDWTAVCAEAASSSPPLPPLASRTAQRARASPHAFQGDPMLPEAPGPRSLISPFISAFIRSVILTFPAIFNILNLLIFTATQKYILYTFVKLS